MKQLGNIIQQIQSNCDTFISGNMEEILLQLNFRKTNITGSYADHKVFNAPNNWGIYVFWVSFDCEFKDYSSLFQLWRTSPEGKKIIAPAMIKKRFVPILRGKEYCLYIGKSEDLSKRISQHIHLSAEKNTYGLKLSQMIHLHPIWTVSYSYYQLVDSPELNLDAYRAILVILERRLREKLKPLIGKQ